MDRESNQDLNTDLVNKEYNIKNGNELYNLRIEINQNDVNFILKNLNTSLYYIYKNKIKISELIKALNIEKNSNYNLILKTFDNIYKKNKIIINKVDDNNIKIIFEKSNMFEKIKFEINLEKKI